MDVGGGEQARCATGKKQRCWHLEDLVFTDCSPAPPPTPNVGEPGTGVTRSSYPSLQRSPAVKLRRVSLLEGGGNKLEKKGKQVRNVLEFQPTPGGHWPDSGSWPASLSCQTQIPI